MFGEVQFELVKIILLNVFLSTVIFFLIADLIALVFGMKLWYIVVASAVYFAVALTSELRKISVRVVEERNPEMRELLRTAKDNQDQDTLMAHALFAEVLDKMRRVSSGTFLDFRKLMLKISAVFVLAIVLVSLAFFDINLQRFEDPLRAPLSALGRALGFGTAGSGEDAGAAGDAGDIFGEARVADLGDDALIATVKPGLDNPDFSQIDPSDPSANPLDDLGGADAGFNDGGPGSAGSGLDERDLQRSFEYAKQTQGSG